MSTPESRCCPECGSTNIRSPRPAAMEDDDFRWQCAICLVKHERDEFRSEFIRRYDPQQGQGSGLSLSQS